jgi:hypothetical protein
MPINLLVGYKMPNYEFFQLLKNIMDDSQINVISENDSDEIIKYKKVLNTPYYNYLMKEVDNNICYNSSTQNYRLVLMFQILDIINEYNLLNKIFKLDNNNYKFLVINDEYHNSENNNFNIAFGINCLLEFVNRKLIMNINTEKIKKYKIIINDLFGKYILNDILPELIAYDNIYDIENMY